MDEQLPVGSLVRIREPEDAPDQPIGTVVISRDAMGQVHVRRDGVGVEVYAPDEVVAVSTDGEGA
ncbi:MULTISPECIES: hypothetical protein [unclassified Blastococcus]